MPPQQQFQNPVPDQAAGFTPDPYLGEPVKPKRRGIWIFLSLFFLILLVGVGAIAYIASTRSRTQLAIANQQTSEANTKISQLQSEITTLKTANTQLEYINIEDLGVRMKRSEPLDSVVHFTNSTSNTSQPFAHFTSSDVLGSVMLNPSGPFGINQCALIDSPLGIITRYNAGVVVAGKKVEDQLGATMKKVGDLYYGYSTPSSSCSSNTKVTDVISPQQKALSEAFATLEVLPASSLTN